MHLIGTGKTTTLAAAVLAFLIENPSHRVLVSCPSHAACDAATLAILKHWPVSELGEPHKGNVVRMPNITTMLKCNDYF